MSIELIKRLSLDNEIAKNILVIGVFHGDEEQGEALVNRYLGRCADGACAICGFKDNLNDFCSLGKVITEPFKKGNLKNNLYYIPRLNSAKTRVNRNSVDLNRNFPTKNWGEDTSAAGDNAADYYGGRAAASEEETKFIVSLMEQIKFDAILTIHSPYKIVNYDGDKDGEALKLAQKISEFTGYPVQKDIGYPTPGSFGTYAGVERDIPVITVEVDENELYSVLYPKFKKVFEYLENYY